MAISVVHGSPQSIWVPVEMGATVYVGGIVSVNNSAPTEGVIVLPDAAGVFNETNCDTPYGVCIGTNRKNPLFSATYLTELIAAPAAADPHGGASIEYVGVEGPWAKGDPIPMVKVALITPHTVLRAPLRNAAIGTAPSVVTATAGDANGLGVTTGAINFTPENTSISTIYCRSGANAGVYRLLDSASTTVHTWDTATRNDTEIGSTWVAVPVRTHGLSTVMFDATTASFIDVADNPVLAGTNRWGINVIRLDLSTAGDEYVEFTFELGHFLYDIERVA